MKIKIVQHIMPWEIDYALLSFIQLKKSKYHLPDDVDVVIETQLNLSSYIINWKKTKLPKEFFIEKYNTISNLLSEYTHIKKIYDGNELYGCLDSAKSNIDKDTEYYLTTCPDIYFSEYTIPYLIESAKQLNNKYFVITPEISKVGDSTWDEITNPKYLNIPYSDYLNVDTFDIRYDNKISNRERALYPIKRSKWAGWCDLYSKGLFEELCPFLDEWNGYGPWDWYSMIITEYVKQYGVDFQQYILRGETIWMYPSGPLIKNGINGFSKYYKDFISLNDIPNQRQNFESRMNDYVNQTLTNLKNKNIW